MTPEETISYNKLIAEFMGVTYKNKSKAHYRLQRYGIFHSIDTLKYHTSWDWLMPCCEKIEAMGWVGVEIHQVTCRIYEIAFVPLESDLNIEANGQSKIEAVWLAVVSFIKWYNQNKLNIKK